jgi:GNAT superfamily N-acetyltransferase
VYLTEVDHHDHEALVALDAADERGVGVARFVRADDPGVAEVAVTVVDDWQGLGVGTVLLERLTDRAREEGIRRFAALIQADNRRSLDLMRTIGTVTSLAEGSDLILAIELPRDGGIGAPLATALHEAAASGITAQGLFHEIRNRAQSLHERRQSNSPQEDRDASQP